MASKLVATDDPASSKRISKNGFEIKAERKMTAKA
jgi:hypothetical protein